jgi:uncharacterized membrane-anchored protein
MIGQVLAAVIAVAAGSPPPEEAVNWLPGPAEVDLGDQARIKIGAGHSFAAGADTQRLMEKMGNVISHDEVGLIVPNAEDEEWMLVFEYRDVGYVKDDEKDKIDKDALFKSISEGTERGNERRKQMGIPALHVTGWFEEPHYDQASHNLVWALRAKNEGGEEVVNYNMRVLGRQGYMSVTLVDSPASLAGSRVEAAELMKSFDYRVGRSYAEFRPGDKVAEYGLVALVAGGAGAAAAKMGFFAWLAKVLAKSGKAIVVGVIAIGVAIRGWLARLFGRREE